MKATVAVSLAVLSDFAYVLEHLKAGETPAVRIAGVSPAKNVRTAS